MKMASRARRRGGPQVSFFAFQDIITAVSGILIIIVLLMTLLVEDENEDAVSETKLTQARENLAMLSHQLGELKAKEKRVQEELELMLAPLEGRDIDQILVATKEMEELLRSTNSRLRQLKIDIREVTVELGGERKVLGMGAKLKDIEALDAQIVSLTAEIQRLEKELGKESESLVIAEEELDSATARSMQVFLRPDVGDGKEPFLVVLSDGCLIAEKFDDPGVRKVVRGSVDEICEEFDRIVGGISPKENYFAIYIKPSGILLHRALVPEFESQDGVASAFEFGKHPLPEDNELGFSPEGGTP